MFFEALGVVRARIKKSFFMPICRQKIGFWLGWKQFWEEKIGEKSSIFRQFSDIFPKKSDFFPVFQHFLNNQSEFQGKKERN